jgi:ribosomal protein L40E
MATAMRCPQCGALVGEGAQWCTQCYADLRPPAPEPPVPEPEHADAPGATEDGDAADPLPPPAARARHRTPGEDAPEPGWPCPQCGTVNPLAAPACSACGSGFLAPLAADRGIPAVPALAGMPRGVRIAAALVAILVILFLLGAVVWLVS